MSSQTVFTAPPLTPLEQIAKLVSTYLPDNRTLPDDEIQPLLNQLESSRDRAAAQYFLSGKYPELVQPYSDPVVMDLHNRYTPTFFHTHGFFELLYVCCGHCNNLFADRILPLEAGELLFLPPKMRHALSVFSDETVVMNFYISRELLDQFITSIPHFESPLHEFYNRRRSDSPYVLHLSTDAAFSADVQRLQRASLQVSSGLRPALVEAGFRNLLVTLLERYSNQMQLMDIHQQSDRMSTILQLIQAQMQTITLRSLAYQLGYSYAYLSRLIKSSTGRSFIDLRRDIRLEHAARLLRETEQTVDSIAHSCGYETRNQLYVQFKAHYGQTPIQYRISN